MERGFISSMSDIKDEAAQHLIESERLDTALQIINFKNWIGLAFFLLVVLGLLFWSVVGKLPVTVSGMGIMVDPSSMFQVKSKYRAEVRSINVLSQETVQSGDVLLELQMLNGNELGEIYQVTAPVDGEIHIINVIQGDVVQPGDELIFIQKNLDVNTVKILGFVPFYPGQNLEQGMKTRLKFPNQDLAQYGQVEGEVDLIFPYMPDLENYYVQMLPSQTLREEVIQGGPQKMFLVNPKLNPQNPTGLTWTQGSGPNAPIKAGEIGFLQVEVDYVRPISFLFPSKGMKQN